MMNKPRENPKNITCYWYGTVPRLGSLVLEVHWRAQYNVRSVGKVKKNISTLINSKMIMFVLHS